MATLVWAVISGTTTLIPSGTTWTVLLFDASGVPIGQEGSTVNNPLLFEVPLGLVATWTVAVTGFPQVNHQNIISVAFEALTLNLTTGQVTSSEDTVEPPVDGGENGGGLLGGITTNQVLLVGGGLLAAALLFSLLKKKK